MVTSQQTSEILNPALRYYRIINFQCVYILAKSECTPWNKACVVLAEEIQRIYQLFSGICIDNYTNIINIVLYG